jgi:hypothetical protein
VATDGPSREIETSAIVLLGSFNPSIFQPAWLAEQGLLRREEADAAVIQIIHPEVTAFTAGWLALQVTANQFLATSSDVNAHELVRDFAVGTFRVLEHTPVGAAGLNHAFHYGFPSYDLNVRLGDRIVPSEPWPMLTNPLYTNLQITSERTDGKKGAVNVQVQPSLQVEGGLFVAVNDHFDLTEKEKPVAASAAVELLAECWDASRARAEDVVTGLMADV